MDLDNILALIGIGVATVWLEREGYLRPMDDTLDCMIPQLPKERQSTVYEAPVYNPVSSTGSQTDLGNVEVEPAPQSSQTEVHSGVYNEAPNFDKRNIARPLAAQPLLKKQKHEPTVVEGAAGEAAPAGGLFGPPPD